jgi:RNA polymerase-binding transcription factor DksA
MRKEQLESFRQRLLDIKQQILSELTRLDGDIEENTQAQYQKNTLKSNRASGIFGRHALLAERDMLNYNLREIERALGRFENGRYGFSEISGKPIPLERLEVLPWASRLAEEEAVFSQD